MPTEYSPSGSRRSSSRRNGRRSENREDRPSNRMENPRPEPKKKSFFAKIIGFFSGKSEEQTPPASEIGYSRASSPSRSSGSPERSRDRSDRPERTERSERPERGSRPTGMRKPEAVEVTSPRLYIGNLSFDASESDLQELFSGVGSVQNVEIVMHRQTMKSKGFGFIQMQSIDEAKRAVAELHDKEYMGRKLVVSGAKAVEERRSERNRQAEQPEQSEE